MFTFGGALVIKKTIKELLEEIKASATCEIVDAVNADNYARAKQYVSLTEDLNSLMYRYPSLLEPADFSPEAGTIVTSIDDEASSATIPKSPEADSKEVNAVSDSSTIYFIANDVLYKIGQRRGNPGETYRKVVPLADASIVCDSAIAVGRGRKPFTVLDVKRHLDLPDYKVQITIAALCQSGVLSSPSRGKYCIAEGERASNSYWISRLKSLQKREDLLQ